MWLGKQPGSVSTRTSRLASRYSFERMLSVFMACAVLKALSMA